jgi:hypothetical protein
MRSIERYFPLSHGLPRVDDRCHTFEAHRTGASLLKKADLP